MMSIAGIPENWNFPVEQAVNDYDGGVSKLIKERKLHKLRKKANLIIADYQ